MFPQLITNLCALSGLVMLQGTRTSGRIAGNGLRLVLIDGSVVDSRLEFDLIPDSGRISRLLVGDALRYCLFIEKHSIATLLKQAGFSSLNNWSGIIVAGTGIPDYSTRSLLRRIDLKCPRMILVALVDGGPAGLISMLTLRHGANRTLHESFGVPRIQWAGILPTQINYLQSIDVPTVEFTSCDNKALAGLEARTDIPPVWQRHLVQMGELRRKIDLDNVPLDILKRWTRRCLTHGTDNPYALGEQALGF